MMKRTAENLIAIARAEIGYHEKASNANLDSKTGNSGSNNYPKYGRDLANAGYYNGNKNGYAWCDQFVDWCFFILCDRNKTEAEKMECQQDGLCGAGCEYSARYYKNHGRLDSHPKVGDQAFFGDRDHTGIVSAVHGNRVTVIEGNKHDQVSENTYTVGGGWLSNEFGHPFYEESTGAAEKPVPVPVPENKGEDEEMYTKDLFIRDIQNVSDISVDGIVGHNTMNATKTVSRYKNNTCRQVLPIQKRLKALGYYTKNLDGIAGSGFDAAVKAYQRHIGNKYIDGELTAGCSTWRHLLNE